MRIALPDDGAPSLELIDAERAGCDEAGLRELARAWAPARGAAAISRSYRFPYALVGWHSDRLGVDIERIEPCSPALAQSISTPSELAAGMATGDEAVISLWSGKEALAKALGDALRYDPRRLESPLSWPGGAAGPWRGRRLPVADGYCAWVCWRGAPTPPHRPR